MNATSWAHLIELVWQHATTTVLLVVAVAAHRMPIGQVALLLVLVQIALLIVAALASPVIRRRLYPPPLSDEELAKRGRDPGPPLSMPQEIALAGHLTEEQLIDQIQGAVERSTGCWAQVSYSPAPPTWTATFFPPRARCADDRSVSVWLEAGSGLWGALASPGDRTGYGACPYDAIARALSPPDEPAAHATRAPGTEWRITGGSEPWTSSSRHTPASRAGVKPDIVGATNDPDPERP